MRKTIEKTIMIDGNEIPAKIHFEMRQNVRASIGRKHAILRIPQLMLKSQHDETFQWFENWLKTQIQNKPEILSRFNLKIYKNGDIIQVGSRTYRLQIEETNLQSHRAKINNGVILLRLAPDTKVNTRKAITHLLSRIISQDFKPDIVRRVQELNALYFQKEIKSINLKYNKSNWGSCSSKSNINLSSRLLFAPDDVIDYVIIHELSHLEEMNHSAKFWTLVSNAMPNYKEKEIWLKEHGHECYF